MLAREPFNSDANWRERWGVEGAPELSVRDSQLTE